MAWSYDRLWILLIQRKMTKTKLKQEAKLNNTVVAKMGKCEPVTMEAIGKICATLKCRIEDVVEFVPDEEE